MKRSSRQVRREAARSLARGFFFRNIGFWRTVRLWFTMNIGF